MATTNATLTYLRTCACGCGEPTGADFAPGHDRDALARLIDQVWGSVSGLASMLVGPPRAGTCRCGCGRAARAEFLPNHDFRLVAEFARAQGGIAAVLRSYPEPA
jgi:hypothetical protein